MSETITILFADVPNSTIVSKRRLWRRLEAAVIAYGGRTEIRADGALLAYFQSASRQDDAERAVRAALAIQDEIQEIQTEARLHTNAVSVDEVSIGINMGPEDAIGDPRATPFQSNVSAIALAEYLQKQASPGTIAISHPTYRRVRGIFNVTTLDDSQQHYYCVQSAKPRPFRQPTRGIAGVETRMVGRQDKLQQLVAAMEQVLSEHHMQVVTLVGPPGIGKARLIYELHTQVDLHTQEMWLFRARALPQMQALPYALIRQMFSHRSEIFYSDTAATARDKLVRHVQQFIPGTGGEEIAHFIGQLLGFNFAYSPYLRNVDGRQLLKRALHLIPEYFAAITADDPVVMFLEDLHWADRASLDLIEHIMAACTDLPLLMITSTEPSLLESRPHWRDFSIKLQPLATGDSALFVLQALRKLSDVTGQLVDRIVKGAQGLPLTLEQRILMLMDEAIIEQTDSGWALDASRIDSISFPSTLDELLRARIERLNPEQREVLMQAAVVGIVFWNNALRGHDVDGCLSKLHHKDYITPLDYSGFAVAQEYRFNHPLLCATAYDMLQKPATYHGDVASWRVANSAQRVREYAGLLAYHYERADRNVQAIEYLVRAGKEAYRVGAFEEARHFFERALNIMSVSGSLSRKATLMVWLGDVHWQLQNYDAAHALLSDSLLLSRQIGDQKVIADTVLLLGRVTLSQQRHTVAWEYLQESLQLSRAIGDREGVANTEMYLGQWAMKQDHLDEAKSHFEACLSIHQSLSRRYEMAQALASLSEIAYHQGSINNAKSLARVALTTARDVEAVVVLLQILVLIAAILVADDVPDRARWLLQAVLNHPALTDELRQQAIEVMDIEAVPDSATGDLELLIDSLLKNDW